MHQQSVTKAGFKMSIFSREGDRVHVEIPEGESVFDKEHKCATCENTVKSWMIKCNRCLGLPPDKPQGQASP
jgi:hypothetical protein